MTSQIRDGAPTPLGEAAGPKNTDSVSRHDQDSRRVVLGAAVGFDVAQVRVFVESLRGVGYSGDVVLLVRWPGFKVIRYLRSRNMHAIPIFQKRSFSRSVHARRYAIYAKFLGARRHRYDQVMVSDVRDVVFQRHPFDGITSSQCHFFLEGTSQKIGEDPTNSRWVSGCGTVAQVDAVSSRRICCSGITIGGIDAMLGYLDRMAGQISQIPFRIYREIGHGYDQGLHNLLVHLDQDIDGTLVENNGHIATMGLGPESLYMLDEEAVIRIAGGRVPAICHQYDRFPKFRDAIETRYCIKSSAS